MPAWVYVVSWLALLPFLLGKNAELALLAGLIASVLPRLLWRTSETPVLLWICFYQWVQAFLPVVQAEMAGLRVADFFDGPEFERAVELSLLGVLCFSLGCRSGARLVAPAGVVVDWANFARLRPYRLFGAWLGLSITLEAVSSVFYGTGLLQAVQPVCFIYLAAMVLLFQSVFYTERQFALAGLVLLVEIGMGFVGYFGGFKLALFMVTLAALTFAGRRRRVWGLGAVMVALSIVLGTFWQSIKHDYRKFVSDGEEGQVVRVPLAERLDYLQRALQAADWAGYMAALDSTLERIGYVTYFGHCLRNVPASVPHAEGRLWREAVVHVLMPRLLYPNKPELNDSDRTNEFTGLRVADATEATSIGIGYLGESYVDFGVPGMFIPVLLFGLAVGGCYGLMLRLAPNPTLGVAFGVAILMRSGFLLESSNAKMLGGLVVSTLVYCVILKVAGPAIWRWIAAPSPAPR